MQNYAESLVATLVPVIHDQSKIKTVMVTLPLLKCPQNSKNFHAYGTQPHIMAILHASYVATYVGTNPLQPYVCIYGRNKTNRK